MGIIDFIEDQPNVIDRRRVAQMGCLHIFTLYHSWQNLYLFVYRSIILKSLRSTFNSLPNIKLKPFNREQKFKYFSLSHRCIFLIIDKIQNITTILLIKRDSLQPRKTQFIKAIRVSATAAPQERQRSLCLASCRDMIDDRYFGSSTELRWLLSHKQGL